MSSVAPCELSFQLLTKLREILRTACDDMYEKQRQTPMTNTAMNSIRKHGSQIKAKLDFSLRNAILSSSAFRNTFEVQCCQLQLADASVLNQEQRIVFWCNVYNIMIIHALIRTPICKNLSDRYSLMRTLKYNINGSYFNLIDIEHGVLRARSAKPIILGPPFVWSFSFSERDPKKKYSLRDPWYCHFLHHPPTHPSSLCYFQRMISFIIIFL